MLIPSYNRVSGQLMPQVQGTCGIYSFYNAVCILRDLNSLNPGVPAPKKSEAPSGSGPSLREFSKKQLMSGQGELLSTDEISELVAAHGYAPLAFSRVGAVDGSAKKEFLTMCMREGYPVLIAYMANQVGAKVRYVMSASPGAGAHWSLIIGADSTEAKVIEPNAPRSLETWPIDDLLLSNGKSDEIKFPRYWAKTVAPTEVLRQTLPAPIKAVTPKVDTWRGISPIGQDKSNWKRGGNQVSDYDLGGAQGDRQDQQDLNHVLVAIVPPHGPKK